MASKQYLCCFGRIGNGDLTTLKKEVLNEINKANEVPKPSDHSKHPGDNIKQVEPQKPDDTKLVETEKSDESKNVPNTAAEAPQESIASTSSEPLEQDTTAYTTNSPEVTMVTEAVDVASKNTQVEPISSEANPPVSDPPKSPTVANPSDHSVKNEDNSPSQAEV
ncbi:hypothetical protein K7432_017052 [Basidiobolus ranarum]|uniref:Uncharacterized protein n=1 Tax=Basidiobolus ranarum TaxID=34480 RepID=A0ABR2VKY8_9FUNG